MVIVVSLITKMAVSSIGVVVVRGFFIDCSCSVANWSAMTLYCAGFGSDAKGFLSSWWLLTCVISYFTVCSRLVLLIVY